MPDTPSAAQMQVSHLAPKVQAENERLRKALERIKQNAESWHGADPDGIDHAHHGQQKALNVIAGWCEEALNGE